MDSAPQESGLKFLIDECLSPQLTKLAHAEGYGESLHVVWLNRAGMKDWELKSLILDGSWTFVTKNSVDFRGAPERPGARAASCLIESEGIPESVRF